MTPCVELFPIVRGGGVFLGVVGAAIMLGALHFTRRSVVLAAGACLGSIATALTAYPLAAGAPTNPQIGALAVAVALEVIALAWVMRRFAKRGQRQLTVAILVVVGLHFTLMAPAFGPLIVALGLACTLNAAIGSVVRLYSLPALWFADGALKFGIGAAMLWAHRLPSWLCG